MFDNPLVSIAIPFFNAEKHLKSAIESVIFQTYKNWKLILLDDGSTDASLEIAKEFAKIDSRIEVISDGLNKNLSFRLNQIPSLVHTEYLMRMDADDIMHPEKVEKQLAYLLKNTDVDVLGTNAYSIDENNNVVGIRFAYNTTDKIESLAVNGFIHPTIMAKTKWFRENAYDERALRIEDAELWFRTSKTYRFEMLVEPLFFYREIGGDYYLKYFKGYKSLGYLLKKYAFDIKIFVFCIKYFLVGIFYALFNFLGKEQKLILKRNQVIIRPTYYTIFLNK